MYIYTYLKKTFLKHINCCRHYFLKPLIYKLIINYYIIYNLKLFSTFYLVKVILIMTNPGLASASVFGSLSDQVNDPK